MTVTEDAFHVLVGAIRSMLERDRGYYSNVIESLEHRAKTEAFRAKEPTPPGLDEQLVDGFGKAMFYAGGVTALQRLIDLIGSLEEDIENNSMNLIGGGK